MSQLFIGVDVGYGNTKTANTVFSSGVRKHSTKPPINSMVVETNGGFYSVNHAKSTIQESKTSNEDMLVLTYAAIAEEMKREGITKADIHLGVGVPLTRMGAEKEDMIAYYKKNCSPVFKYEDVTYSIHFLSVNVYPQGYAAVASFLSSLGKLALVVDIGSWTIDILPIREGRPDLSKCTSLSLGTITCMHKINEELRATFNNEVDEVLIKDVMINGTSKDLPAKYVEVIQKYLIAYVDEIMGNLRALKFNLDTTRIVFIGGGATIIKHFLNAQKYEMATVLADVHINAKGYEKLMRRQIQNGGIR
ncbi:MAG: ParM/StbA family protein [Lachnospiraceae bacterium]|nr:ParM/StbA family protein [Lachnospiraceae bacterium]